MSPSVSGRGSLTLIKFAENDPHYSRKILYYVNPTMGTPLAIKAFIVVVLGGLGSVPGALAGGLLLGVVESVAAQFVTATAAAIFSFCLFIAVLLTRPKGLMGKLEI